MVKIFENVDVMSATSDIWSRGSVSFIAVSVHYFHPVTKVLQTKFLACEHFIGAHTADSIASKLNSIFNRFGILKKIKFITTDSASNYIAALKHNGPNYANIRVGLEGFNPIETDSESEDDREDSIDDTDDDNTIEKMVIDGEIYTSETVEIESVYRLLSEINHINCAAHMIDKLGGAPIDAACAKNADFADKYARCMEKLKKIWKIKDSRTKHEYFARETGVHVIGPHRIRWLATYDAVSSA